jgi:beta-lactamase regulating signal transducer with metallopeptidase domain
MWNIFEQPWTLLATAVIVLLVLLALRRTIQEKNLPYLWLLPPLLALLAFGLDYLIETDLEKIKVVITTAVTAVEDENPDAIEPIIADNYRDSLHSTKRDLLYHFRRRLSEPLVEKNITRIISVEISGTQAVAIFTVRIVFDQRSYIAQAYKRLVLTKVELTLQKQPDNQWLISSAELLEIDLQPTSWREIKQIKW